MNFRKLTSTEYPQWEELVRESPQGSIFCSLKWLELFDNEIFGCFREGHLIGGMAGINGKQFLSGGYALTPYQGIVVCDQQDTKYANRLSLFGEICDSFIEFTKQELVGKQISIVNHYNARDMRPFIWDNWEQFIKYTFIIDTTDLLQVWANMEKDTRYEITKAQKSGIKIMEGDVETFDKLYVETFSRKGLGRPISSVFLFKLCERLQAKIYLALNKGIASAGAVAIWDDSCSYYILGASNPDTLGDGATSLALWTLIEDQKGGQIDLVGCNDKKIGLFKRGFGSKLMPYFGVRK